MKHWFMGLALSACVTLLSGCSGAVNFSGTGSVKSASVGRLIVSSMMMVNSSKEDEDRKFQLLAAITPFDLDAKIGDLSDSSEVSDLKFESRDAATDALAITTAFKLSKKYDVSMAFIAPRMRMGFINLVKRPYLMELVVSRDGQQLYRSGGKPFPVEFMKDLLVDKRATVILDRVWDGHLASLAKANKDEEDRKRMQAESQAAALVQEAKPAEPPTGELLKTQVRLTQKPEFTEEGTHLSTDKGQIALYTQSIPEAAKRIIDNAKQGDCLIILSDGPISDTIKGMQTCAR